MQSATLLRYRAYDKAGNAEAPHQQGLSIGEISCETDWSWEVVRLGLRKAGVTAFNNHRNKPGLTWEPSDASEGSRANG